jgi:hypothetical protein
LRGACFHGEGNTQHSKPRRDMSGHDAPTHLRR